MLIEIFDSVFTHQLALVRRGIFAGDTIFPPLTSAGEADEGAAVDGRLNPIETWRINGGSLLMKEFSGLVAYLLPHGR